MGKKITEMSNAELESEIRRLQQTRIPSAPQRNKPKRLDQTKQRKKTLLDLVEEG
jgi:hypothetical protein